ncbi:MAG: pyrroloquinoline quinone biosynthesis peptide chaperone PqqD [Pseudomonadota bacterium]
MSDPVPFLPRGVRRHFDKVRGCAVLLGPERALMLDEISDAILGAVDGERGLTAICTVLAETYDAPLDVIRPDTEAFLADLAGKRLLDYRGG